MNKFNSTAQGSLRNPLIESDECSEDYSDAELSEAGTSDESGMDDEAGSTQRGDESLAEDNNFSAQAESSQREAQSQQDVTSMIRDIHAIRQQPDPDVMRFIDNMIYPQIFFGEHDFSGNIHYKVKQKGEMNENESRLFKFVNKVLQFPPCLSYCGTCADSSARTYAYSIARYVSFMANRGTDENSFSVDGISMADCMDEHLSKRGEANGMATSSGTGSIENFKSALHHLLKCLGIYRTRDMTDIRERKLEIERNWTNIPHIDEVMSLARDRRRSQAKKAELFFHNQVTSESYCPRYTLEQIRQMMRNSYELTGKIHTPTGKRKKSIYDGVNSVLEVLLGHSCLFRGQTKATLELSVMTYSTEETSKGPIDTLGFEIKRSKTSQGKSRHMGCFRHRDVELCLVSAIAMSLWYRFDFKDLYAPLAGDRLPDFADKKSWYRVKVLFADSAKSRNNERVSWSYQNSLVEMCLDSIGFKYNKKTHIGRKIGAQMADAYGLAASQVKRAGLWSNEVIDNSYLNYPFQFMHVTSGHKIEEPYYISRDYMPPVELQKKIFPWLEEAAQKVENRVFPPGATKEAKDEATPRLLHLLEKFRVVILQDLAVMSDKTPNSIFSKHEITRDPLFLQFKAELKEHMAKAPYFEATETQKDVARILSPIYVAKLDSFRFTLERIIAKVEGDVGALKKESREKLNKCNDEINALKTEMIAFKTEMKALEARSEMRADERDRETRLREERNLSLVQSWIEEGVKTILQAITDGGAMPQQRILGSIAAAISDVGSQETMPRVSAIESAPPPPPSQAPAPIVAPRTPEPRPMARQSHDFAKQHPELQMSTETNSVPDLLEEWYESKGNTPSVVERDRLYQTIWRGNPSLYKRRSVIINFIESLSRMKEFRGATRMELGIMLDSTRDKRHLSALCTDLALQRNRAPMIERLKALWLAKQREREQFS